MHIQFLLSASLRKTPDKNCLLRKHIYSIYLSMYNLRRCICIYLSFSIRFLFRWVIPFVIAYIPSTIQSFIMCTIICVTVPHRFIGIFFGPFPVPARICDVWFLETSAHNQVYNNSSKKSRNCTLFGRIIDQEFTGSFLFTLPR